MKKVAIVGVEGSGKTVLMAVMGDKYRSPDGNGVFLAPVSRATYAYCAKQAASLRAGQWPLATESGVHNLDWTLMCRQDSGTAPAELGQLSFLDFGGEIYRLAFGDGAAVELDEQRKQSVELLKGHVRDADALIVLVNLSDIINSNAEDERTIEMNWLSQAILTYAFETAGKRNVALVFSQYYTYYDTIVQCGGLKGTFARYLPEVAARYGNRLYIFPIAAVDKTIPAPDGSGFPIPAPDFRPVGLEKLLEWMCKRVGKEKEDAPRPQQKGNVLGWITALSIIAFITLAGIVGIFNWDRQDRNLRNAQQEMLDRAWAGGYDQYIGKKFRGDHIPGNIIGRFYQRLVHGGSGFADVYRADLDRAADEARAKWLDKYNNASPEEKRLMRLEVIQRRKSYNEYKLQEAGKRYGLGASEADRLDNIKPEEQEPPLSREQFVRRYVTGNNLPTYSYYRTYRDPNTMMWVSSDPSVKLPDELVRQNAQIETAWENYQRGLNKPKSKPKPQEPKADPNLFLKNRPKVSW